MIFNEDFNGVLLLNIMLKLNVFRDRGMYTSFKISSTKLRYIGNNGGILA